MAKAPPVDKRRQILDAAIHVFARQGFHACRVSDIADEADGGVESPRSKLEAVAGFIVDSYRHDPELMKVIIVEVTRAANSFGRTHLPEIRRAYDSIGRIVAEGQERGEFRSDIDPAFASMSFYGAIEQLLTGWIFEVIPATSADYDQAKELVVATICDGLEPR